MSINSLTKITLRIFRLKDEGSTCRTKLNLNNLKPSTSHLNTLFRTERLRHKGFHHSFRSALYVMIFTFCTMTFALLALPSPSKGASLSNPWLTITPKKITQGSLVLVTYVGPSSLKPEKILWKGHNFPFFRDDKGIYQSFLGIPLSTRQRRALLTLIASAHGNVEKRIFRTMVYKKHFPVRVLYIKKRVKLGPKTIEKIKRERKALNKILKKQSPLKYWHGRFIKPVNGKVTSAFGVRRKINGTTLSIHHGTDFRAPMRTSVKAINSGVVVYCDEMVLSGLTIVIDHGMGLYSLYGHLSATRVKVGDNIKKGQTIGLSGNTGRSTGPHLHLGVILSGIAVDPLSLIHLPL